MPADKYPRPFTCANPSCGKLLGIVNRDHQRIVSLYVLRTARPACTTLDESEFTRADFSVMNMGYGDVPCPCGNVTTWHWNNQLLSRLTNRRS